jgi:hypothetical protein
MRDNFYVVLPSNSSSSYFPDNTTTHFITRLPQPLRLQGVWGVSLTDIQIPMTFLHFSQDEKTLVKIKNFISEPPEEEEVLKVDLEHHIVPRGLYQTIDDLVKTVNETSLRRHLIFTLNRFGYVTAQRSCTDCMDITHGFRLSSTLAQIFGYETQCHILATEKSWIASRPASLIRALPTTLFVYTDICESYITGDVQTPLLRTVSLDIESYVYGSVKYKSFATAKYIPLLHTDLQTIEIDIRDEFGQPIPFEYGTLTATLHFKRLD